jgi:hypothetical protein
MARKTVKTIEISGITGAVYGATVGNPKTADIDSTAAYGDTEFSEIPRNCKHNGDLTVTILNEGGAAATLEALAGTVANVTLTVNFWDGDSATGTETVSGKYVIVSTAPGEVNIDGDQKATVAVTIRKHGPTVTQTQGN